MQKSLTGIPYSDLVLPTTKHERVLDLTTFFYNGHVLTDTTNIGS